MQFQGKGLHQPPLLQLAREQSHWQQCHPCALRCSLGQGEGGVKHSAPQHRAGQARCRKPCRPLIGTVAAQQGQPGQVTRLLQPLGQGGGAHGREWCLKNLLGVGAMPGPVSKADGIVQPLSGHVHPVVVGKQAQVHKRVGLLKVSQPRQQPAHGERAHHAHGQHFARSVFADLFQRRLHACEGIAQRGQQRQPLVRQCQASG